MLSKNRIKFLHSLKLKKYRDLHSQFLAEGTKLVMDLLESNYKVLEIFAVKGWIHDHAEKLKSIKIPWTEVTEEEIARMTNLSTSSPVSALCSIPERKTTTGDPGTELILALDEIKDPGNLGTIIRIADWFGIRNIICSHGSVDLYNPKVVQSTMGSIARVHVMYTSLPEILSKLDPTVKVYGTFLTGKNIYQADLGNKGIIILGNESAGISREVKKFVTDEIYIPSFDLTGHAESLNVSMAAAVVCSEFRRRTINE